VAEWYVIHDVTLTSCVTGTSLVVLTGADVNITSRLAKNT